MENNKKPCTKRPKQYPLEIRQQAIDLFQSCAGDSKTRKDASVYVAHLLGIGGSETVLAWVRQAEADSGKKLGMTTDENEEFKRLRRENAEIKRVNGILKVASAFFAAELDRPLGILQAELTKKYGPWEGFEQLNLETARWVKWFNSGRISEHNGFGSPIEIERLWYSEEVDARRHRKGRSITAR